MKVIVVFPYHTDVDITENCQFGIPRVGETLSVPRRAPTYTVTRVHRSFADHAIYIYVEER